MTVGERIMTCATVDPDYDVFVSLCKADGTAAVLSIDDVRDSTRTTLIEIREEACR